MSVTTPTVTSPTTPIPRAAHVDELPRAGDGGVVVHRITRECFPACARVGKSVCTRIARLRWADAGLCTIHSPYYLYYPSTDHLSRKATL